MGIFSACFHTGLAALCQDSLMGVFISYIITPLHDRDAARPGLFSQLLGEELWLGCSRPSPHPFKQVKHTFPNFHVSSHVGLMRYY